MTKYKGSLELNWINKDKSLLYEIDEEEGMGIKPVWVEKDDMRVSEPRILKLKEEYGDTDNENMLIKGDNLLALKTLIKEFKNREEKDKVKCIYIDPPFNTGNAFEHYDDNLERSQWLTMMRDRLVLLRKLLREDGAIFVHVDDNEMAYCKILLDEIFGRDCFLNQVTVQMKLTAGASGGGEDKRLKKNVEYLLIYTKNMSSDRGFVKFNDVYEEVDLFSLIDEMEASKKSWKYTSILLGEGEYVEERTIFDAKGQPITIKKYRNIQRTTINKIITDSKSTLTREIIYNNYFDKIFSDTNAQTSIRTKIIDEFKSLQKDEMLIASYVPRSGRDKGKFVEHCYISPTIRRVIWLKDSAQKRKNKIFKTEKLGTYWSGFPLNNLTKEGGVRFPHGKKPESLVSRIIELSTLPDEIILDSFAGSGTTGAVANKLERKWILIEIGNHASTHCIPRLRRVINGEDQGGVSKEVNWQGGGGFRYYEVGESIIKDMDMNWDMALEEMSRAVFMNFDYSMIEGDTHTLETGGDEFYLGKQKGGIAICLVTKGTKIIRRTELNKLVKDLSKKYPNQKLTIFTNMGVAVKPEELSDKLDVKKIPESILKKYRMV